MKLFRRSLDRPPRRGQGMVEFALVLPLLALLLVMAVDFGRVFFGWIALQNATRIAADTASQRADAWPTAQGATEIGWRDDYETFITRDLQSANCEYPTPHPDPTFTNMNAGDPHGQGDHDFGDLATVRLECQFELITPLAQNIIGGPVQLAAEATFAINGMVVIGVPDPPPPPPEPCPVPVASFVTSPLPTAGGRVNGNVSPLHRHASPPPRRTRSARSPTTCGSGETFPAVRLRKSAAGHRTWSTSPSRTRRAAAGRTTRSG